MYDLNSLHSAFLFSKTFTQHVVFNQMEDRKVENRVLKLWFLHFLREIHLEQGPKNLQFTESHLAEN